MQMQMYECIQASQHETNKDRDKEWRTSLHKVASQQKHTNQIAMNEYLHIN
jgi:hypothetical protein